MGNGAEGMRRRFLKGDPGDGGEQVGTSEPAESEKMAVREEVEKVRGFVSDLSLDDLHSGNWFVKLLAFSLNEYRTQVTPDYFRAKYPNLPPDAIARARVQLAARYSMIEGGLSAAAYTGVVAATIGSGGSASPLTLPAGGASFAVDLSYTSYLQLRLAYDLSVIYGVPLDIHDPEDMWKLVRIAFAIKSGEVGGGAVMKAVPAMVRPLVKKFYSGGVLAGARGLPVIGRHLLQRNVIKFAVPAVGVPVTVGLNYWTTKVAGDQGIEIMRREARIVEAAERVVDRCDDAAALLWSMWTVVDADGSHAESQRALFHHVTKAIAARGGHDELLTAVRSVVDVDPRIVESSIASAEGDLRPVYEACVLAAAVDGSVSGGELDALRGLAERIGLAHDDAKVKAAAKSWR